jgi:hypothetical protein
MKPVTTAQDVGQSYEENLRQLLAAFWNSVRDDLHERGVTTDDGLPYSVRKLPYRKRVTIEREGLKETAEEFLDSPDFVQWAELCGLEADYLREAIRCQ